MRLSAPCSFWLILETGHDVVRRKLPSCFSSGTWKPWAGILTAMIQAAAMVVSTVVARSNGFDANFAQLFGLWTLRPRVAVATSLWCLLSPRSRSYRDREGHNPYKWTFKDMLLAECLLNLVSIPFAVHFFGQRGGQSKQCGCDPDAGNECPILGIDVFYDCMIAVSLIGAASFFLLVCWLLLECISHSKKGDSDTLYRSLEGKSRGVDKMLKFVIFGFGSGVMLGACACQWLIWSCKHMISPELFQATANTEQQLS